MSVLFVADRPAYAILPRRQTLGADFPWGALISTVGTIGVGVYSQMAAKKTQAKALAEQKKAQAAADAQAAAAAQQSYDISVEQAKSAEAVKVDQWAKVLQYGTAGLFILGGGVLAWFVAKSLKK